MARRFTNGTTDEISFGSFSALEGVGAATISVWVRRRASIAWSHIVCKMASGPSGIILLHGGGGFGDDGIYAEVAGATAGDLYINNVCTVNTWVHVALRFDGSATGNDRFHLYINGTQQAVTRASTTYPATLGGSGANLRVGGTDHETDVRPSDDVAWLGVWTSALTDAQIASIAQGLNPARLGPTLFAPLFGLSSEPDLAGGLSGTVTGTSVVDGPRVGWGAPIWIPQSAVYSESASDSAAATETAAGSLTAALAVADSAAATDSATAGLTASDAASDTAAGTDAAAAGLSVATSAADSADATDSATAGLSAAESASDSAAGTDAAVGVLTVAASASDDAAATDAAAGALVITVAVTDTAAATDATTDDLAGGAVYNESAADAADASETAVAALIAAEAVADAADATDAATASVVAAVATANNLHPLNRVRSRYAVRLGGEMVFVDSPQALQAAIDDFEQQTQERARRKGDAVAKKAPQTTPKAVARSAPRVSVVDAPEVDKAALAAQMAATNARIRAAYENATRAALIARYMEIEMRVQDDEAALMALD